MALSRMRFAEFVDGMSLRDVYRCEVGGRNIYVVQRCLFDE